MKNLSAEIVAVGTELLLGDILNTNAQFLSKELSLLGFNVFFQTVVGDNPERLSSAIGLALNRADVVITSGGLGPTDDDLTKETVAHHLGLELVEDEESLLFIREFFKKRDTFPKSNLKQGLIPKGAKAVKNDNGTAPGVIAEKDGKTVIMLPGPPNEIIPMFNDKIKPYLEKMTGATIVSETLRVFGKGESQVAEELSDLMEKANPTIAPYAKTGEVTLRLTAKAETEEEAKKLLSPLKEEVIKRLGDFVYNTEDISLSETVADILKEKNLTVATAESCTAGKLSAALTDPEGASSVFNMGVVTYSNEAKEALLGVKHETLEKFGAVSEETALEMAEGIKKAAKSDIGIGITGIAGPGGGTKEKPVGLVYVGVASKNHVFAKKLNLWGDRNKVRTLAVLNALDLIRREATNL
ncbi:MAG: competence/damage-inducible protein A [Clostridia bacterium]|nr:competence/damage-inducible protein A [Clostridia bacterium]